MTIGQILLLKILESQSANLLMTLDVADFQPEFEKPVYDFIVDYYRRHSALPPVDLVRTTCKLDEPLEGALTFWYDEFLKRKFLIHYDSFINNINQTLSRGDIVSAAEQVQTMSINLTHIGEAENPVRTREDMIRNTMDRLAERRAVGGNVGTPTPWGALTTMFHGFTGGNIYVFAGRKKMGKTQILMLCANRAFLAAYNPLIVSMEMTEEEYSNRAVSLFTNIGLNNITTGRISSALEIMIRRTLQNISHNGQYYFREGFFNSSTAQIEHMVIMLRPRILFIDGAYLVRPMTNTAKMSGWERVAQTMMELKLIAGKYNIPVVCTYQFNREGEVHLSDSIAQIATTVIGVYEVQDRPNVRLLRVIDNRNGERGEVLINWDFNNVDFRELEFHGEANMQQFLDEDMVGD
jgi:replicative DNA helicase